MLNIDVSATPQIAVTKALFDPETSKIEINGLPTERHHAAALLGVLVDMLTESEVLTPQEALQITAHAAGFLQERRM